MCAAGTYNPNASYEPSCQSCAVGTYSAAGSVVCAAQQSCGPGQVALHVGNTTRDTECLDCPNDTYMSTLQHQRTSCTTVTKCSPKEYETQAPTLSSNRKCSQCTQCLELEFLTAPCTLTTDRACTKIIGDIEFDLGTETSYIESGIDLYQAQGYSATINVPNVSAMDHVTILEPLALVGARRSIPIYPLGVYIVQYRLSYPTASSLIAARNRTIVVQDTIPPNLTLVGDPVLNLQPTWSFNDEGAVAYDAHDGFLNFTSTDSFNNISYQHRIQTIVYCASDSSGNRGCVSREVVVRDTLAPTFGVQLNPVILNDTEVYYPLALVAFDDVDGNITSIMHVEMYLDGNWKRVPTSVVTQVDARDAAARDNRYRVCYKATDLSNNTGSLCQSISLQTTLASFEAAGEAEFPWWILGVGMAIAILACLLWCVCTRRSKNVFASPSDRLWTMQPNPLYHSTPDVHPLEPNPLYHSTDISPLELNPLYRTNLDASSLPGSAAPAIASSRDSAVYSLALGDKYAQSRFQDDGKADQLYPLPISALPTPSLPTVDALPIMPEVYQGIGRPQAEHLLRQSAVPGSYLIRYSTQHDALVVSMLKDEAFVHHLVGPVQGAISVDGQATPHASISELIIAEALQPHFLVGPPLHALLPSAPLQPSSIQLSIAPALSHGNISRTQTEAILRARASSPGAFLLRSSLKHQADVVSLLKSSGRCTHHRVVRLGDGRLAVDNKATQARTIQQLADSSSCNTVFGAALSFEAIVLPPASKQANTVDHGVSTASTCA